MHPVSSTAVRTGRGLVLRSERVLCDETVRAFQQAVQRPANPVRFVVVDLTRTPYADSDGLRGLLELSYALEARRTELRIIVAPSSPLRRALSLVGYDRMLALYATGRDAWRGPGRLLA